VLRDDRPAHLYVLCLINLINVTATAGITLQVTAVQHQLIFENWRFVMPEDGTRVPKYSGDGPSTSVLIKTMHVIGAINGEL
jgi:hypothetical protein